MERTYITVAFVQHNLQVFQVFQLDVMLPVKVISFQTNDAATRKFKGLNNLKDLT